MEKHLKAATIFATLLDNQFNIVGIRFGINAILDIIPEVGDIIAALLSCYLLWIAIKMDLPAIRILQMVWNILVNFFIGLIPIIGDATYIFRKANMKNLEILKRYAPVDHPLEGKVVAY